MSAVDLYKVQQPCRACAEATGAITFLSSAASGNFWQFSFMIECVQAQQSPVNATALSETPVLETAGQLASALGSSFFLDKRPIIFLDNNNPLQLFFKKASFVHLAVQLL